MLYLNRAGTPGDNDVIISFDVTLAAGMGQERPGPTAAHRACDRFIQSYRNKLKKFKGDLCTERHEYHDIVRTGKKRVLIIKQVAVRCMIHIYLQRNLQEWKAENRLLIWVICRLY